MSSTPNAVSFAAAPSPPGALFLDRDGTIIVHKPYLHLPEEVELLPGAVAGLQAAVAAGLKLFLFTNQSGVGRGWFTLDDVRRVNEHMIQLLGLGPEVFTDVCVAPEAPDQPAVYRKPSPRFILESIERHRLDPARCWMIGDNETDWEAGLAAGIHAAAVPSDDPAKTEPKLARRPEVRRFVDLEDAVRQILGG